jgi:hypothetical protein
VISPSCKKTVPTAEQPTTMHMSCLRLLFLSSAGLMLECSALLSVSDPLSYLSRLLSLLLSRRGDLARMIARGILLLAATGASRASQPNSRCTRMLPFQCSATNKQQRCVCAPTALADCGWHYCNSSQSAAALIALLSWFKH